MASVLKSKPSKRSFTGNHTLLPAIKPVLPSAQSVQQPAYSLLAWTFGRGSVIWRIWPAVLLHTAFAAFIVYLQMSGPSPWKGNLAIPNVMLTVLGVVIGFVISYRAMSGYDRYWMGRTSWSDVIRNSRTMGRLIWFHVPPYLSPKAPGEERSPSEMLKVMAEKRMALDLVEGFAVALKHHLRGEVGIYYEDLYDLVRPLHDHMSNAPTDASSIPELNQPHLISSSPHLSSSSSFQDSAACSTTIPPKAARFFGTQNVPAINAYGTFDNNRHDLAPGAPGDIENQNIVTGNVNKNLIPFMGMLNSIRKWIWGNTYERLQSKDPMNSDAAQRIWGPPLQPRIGSAKHHPVIAACGENLPLEILRCLSEWFSVLEARGTTSNIGSMIGLISSMEDTLASLERILTTPLPFVYLVHIRHTVWIYLFFLPFQLVAEFGWYTIPGVMIAAFIYLGFLAAGEEIEQPFGYDENDLDLDMFCREIVRVDVENLRKSPCLNAYLPAAQAKTLRSKSSMTLTDLTANEDTESGDDE